MLMVQFIKEIGGMVNKMVKDKTLIGVEEDKMGIGKME